MTIPAYLPYYVFTGSIAIILTIIYGLSAALANADWPRQDRTVVVRAAAAVLIGWFVLAIALGASGAFHASGDQPPSVQYGIFVLILIGAPADLAIALGEAHRRCRAASTDRERPGL